MREAGLDDQERWLAPADELARATAPRCQVSLEEGEKHSDVTGPLNRLLFPACCAMCCGPLQGTCVSDFQIGKGLVRGDRQLRLTVPLCHEHRGCGTKAWQVIGFDRNTSLVTLRVKCREYGRLMVRVNG